MDEIEAAERARDEAWDDEAWRAYIEAREALDVAWRRFDAARRAVFGLR